MRVIVYGVGAIGGGIAARLALAGKNVIGIARGPQLKAIRSDGLLLKTPDGEYRARFAVAADPEEISFGSDDVIFLCMKTQDTVEALQRLRAAGVTDQAIVCAQNGVTNERFALRRFPNVYAMTVMMPTSYVAAGEILAYGTPHSGLFDLGRYPLGIDAQVTAIAATLTDAGFVVRADPDVMRSKYGKLLTNLNNIVDAALVPGEHSRYRDAARNEARAVFRAAGIAFAEAGEDAADRDALMHRAPIPGTSRTGSSTAQSLVRDTGSIETDYLNGEIVLLGRLFDTPVPVNAYFARLAQRLVGEGLKPGAIEPGEVESALADVIAPQMDGEPTAG